MDLYGGLAELLIRSVGVTSQQIQMLDGHLGVFES
jgi:hypothetical protein